MPRTPARVVIFSSFYMNSKTAIPLAALATLFLSACEVPTMTNDLRPQQASRIITCGGSVACNPAGVLIVDSPGFRLASDGVYEWDGAPPVGDLDPAQLRLGRTIAEAPSLEFGIQTGGGVYGDFYFDGDQSKIKLVFSAEDQNGTHLYNNSEVGHDWEDCSGIVGFGRCTNAQDQAKQALNLQAYACGVSVEVGGTGWARKTLPFGISLNASILRYISITAPQTWGERSLPLPASFNTAPLCPSPDESGGGDGGGGDVEYPSWDDYVPPDNGAGPTVCTYWWEIEIETYYDSGNVLVMLEKLISDGWTCS